MRVPRGAWALSLKMTPLNCDRPITCAVVSDCDVCQLPRTAYPCLVAHQSLCDCVDLSCRKRLIAIIGAGADCTGWKTISSAMPADPGGSSQIVRQHSGLWDCEPAPVRRAAADSRLKSFADPPEAAAGIGDMATGKIAEENEVGANSLRVETKGVASSWGTFRRRSRPTTLVHFRAHRCGTRSRFRAAPMLYFRWTVAYMKTSNP